MFSKNIFTKCIISVMLGMTALATQAEVVINQPLAPPKTPSEMQPQESAYSLVSAYDSYQKQSYQDAYDEFAFFAKQQQPQGLMASGYLLFSGVIPRDLPKAKEYLSQAAALKYARAVYLQGLMALQTGDLSKPNKTAERLINQAAQMGDYVAANSLANYHFQHGRYALAQRWNERAVSLGSPAARLNQRLIFNSAREGQVPAVSRNALNPSNSGVIGELRQRSISGDAAASYDLAVRYHKGIGVAVNFGEAVRFYQIAAEQGSREAQKVLPILLSKRSQAGNLNSMWMQEMSNMLPNPVVVSESAKTPEKKHLPSIEESKSANIQMLQEDDPLDGLLRLAPNQ